MASYMTLYIVINVFCVAFVLVLGVHSKIGIGNIRSQRFFKIGIANLIVFFLSDTLWYMMDQAFIWQNLALSYTLKTIYFASSALNGFLWFLFFESLQNSNFINSRTWWYSSIIYVIAIIMLIINIPTGIFFKISDTFEYTRGPVFFILYFLIYFYVVFSAYRAISYSIKVNDYREKRKFRILATYPIVPAICGIIQYFVWRLPIACSGLTLSILIMYLSSMNDVISDDSLTGILNRTQFYRKAKRLIDSSSEDDIYLIMLDLDKFKIINDTYGHIEGDNALITATNCFKDAITTQKSKAILSRYGGDEFVILISTNNDDEINKIIEIINNNLDEANNISNKEYKIGISYGISKRSNEVRTLRDLISKADGELYKMKKEKGTLKK